MYMILLNSPQSSYSEHNATNVRRALSLCDSTPENVLEILKRDTDKSVIAGLRERDLPEDWKETRNMYLDDLVSKVKRARNASLPLEIFSKSHHIEVREAVAKNPECSQTILEAIATTNPDYYDAEVAKEQLRKRFPGSNMLEDDDHVSCHDSEECYVEFVITVERARFIEIYDF